LPPRAHGPHEEGSLRSVVEDDQERRSPVGLEAGAPIDAPHFSSDEYLSAFAQRRHLAPFDRPRHAAVFGGVRFAFGRQQEKPGVGQIGRNGERFAAHPEHLAGDRLEAAEEAMIPAVGADAFGCAVVEHGRDPELVEAAAEPSPGPSDDEGPDYGNQAVPERGESEQR